MSVPSVAIAKDRLKNLLMSDRIQCTQDMTERLSKDLYQVIAKYMELDPEKVTIEITRNDIQNIQEKIIEKAIFQYETTLQFKRLQIQPGRAGACYFCDRNLYGQKCKTGVYDAADPWSGSWSGGHGRYFPD